MAESLLGPDGGNHLGLGIEFHTKFGIILLGHLAAQPHDSVADAVPVIPRILRCLGNFATTDSGVGSVGFPIPRSMMSIPATRFSYLVLLIRPKD